MVCRSYIVLRNTKFKWKFDRKRTTTVSQLKCEKTEFVLILIVEL